MNIEPISTVSVVQNQPAIPRPVTSTTSDRPEEFDSKVVTDEAARIDAATLTVENTQSKDSGADGNTESDARNQATNEQIRQAVEKINKANISNTEAVFGIHEGTNRVTIKLVDKKTKETIKELPPEKTLDMIAKVWEMAGILVDEKR